MFVFTLILLFILKSGRSFNFLNDKYNVYIIIALNNIIIALNNIIIALNNIIIALLSQVLQFQSGAADLSLTSAVDFSAKEESGRENLSKSGLFAALTSTSQQNANYEGPSPLAMMSKLLSQQVTPAYSYCYLLPIVIATAAQSSNISHHSQNSLNTSKKKKKTYRQWTYIPPCIIFWMRQSWNILPTIIELYRWKEIHLNNFFREKHIYCIFFSSFFFIWFVKSWKFRCC